MNTRQRLPRTSAFLLAATIACFAAGPRPTYAQEKPDTSRLTIDRIFASGEFDTEPVDAIHWLSKGDAYVTLERTGKGVALVRHSLASGEKELLAASRQFTPPGRNTPISIERFTLSADGSRMLIFTNGKRIWRRSIRGDYWLYDIASRDLRKLGGSAPPASLMHGKLSPDGNRFAYVQDNNIFVQDLRDLAITQLTKDGSETTLNGVFDWAYEEEFELNSGFRWSPDSQRIAYWQLDSSGVREFHIVDNTVGSYSKIVSIRYPKVGEKNSAARVGVVEITGGATQWLKAPGDPREHYIARIDWTPDGKEVAFQQLNRLQNTNVVFLADKTTGESRAIFTEKDRAWVDVDKDLHWIENGQKFVWLSEKDGWRKAYLISRSGTMERLVTPGDFDVISIEAIDEKNGSLYFIAAPDQPSQRYLYRASLDGKSVTRISPAGQRGSHSYQISPDAQMAVHSFSTFDSPPVSNVITLPDHKSVKSLVENKKLVERLKTLDSPTTEFLRIDIGNPVQLEAWCIKPPAFDSTKKYPVLVWVYGEPAGQTVRDVWSGRRHLWHMMLAQQGYVVLSIDNRGTDAPRGREWRKSIYRQVGILAAEDQAAALRALLKQRPYLDAQRVAIWGWSGGGSMSLNAIFRHPDLYQTAMSVAPVANQRHYDSIYQERYMGMPGDNAKGYRDGSPITHAHKLRGNLLLVHGTGDDNCHYLGTETLIDELIAHNKQFSMLAYPNRSHSISEGANTTRHLYSALTRFLNQHTPAGAK